MSEKERKKEEAKRKHTNSMFAFQPGNNKTQNPTKGMANVAHSESKNLAELIKEMDKSEKTIEKAENKQGNKNENKKANFLMESDDSRTQEERQVVEPELQRANFVEQLLRFMDQAAKATEEENRTMAIAKRILNLVSDRTENDSLKNNAQRFFIAQRVLDLVSSQSVRESRTEKDQKFDMANQLLNLVSDNSQNANLVKGVDINNKPVAEPGKFFVDEHKNNNTTLFSPAPASSSSSEHASTTNVSIVVDESGEWVEWFNPKKGIFERKRRTDVALGGSGKKRKGGNEVQQETPSVQVKKTKHHH